MAKAKCNTSRSRAGAIIQQLKVQQLKAQRDKDQIDDGSLQLIDNLKQENGALKKEVEKSQNLVIKGSVTIFMCNQSKIKNYLRTK